MIFLPEILVNLVLIAFAALGSIADFFCVVLSIAKGNLACHNLPGNEKVITF